MVSGPLKGAEKRRGEWIRAAACLSAESEANEASSADPARTEHRREPERSSGAVAGKAFLPTFVATIVMTSVGRISSRSERRNAFDVREPSDSHGFAALTRSARVDRRPVGGRLCRAKGGPDGSRASSLQQSNRAPALDRRPVGGRLRAKGGLGGSRASSLQQAICAPAPDRWPVGGRLRAKGGSAGSRASSLQQAIFAPAPDRRPVGGRLCRAKAGPGPSPGTPTP